MEDNDRTVLRLFRTYKTVKEMVRDRGYYITQEELDMTLDEFRSQKCDLMGTPQRKLMCFQANREVPGLGSVVGGVLRRGLGGHQDHA